MLLLQSKSHESRTNHVRTSHNLDTYLDLMQTDYLEIYVSKVLCFRINTLILLVMRGNGDKSN